MATIGIDASRALGTAITGTEGYSLHLIRALVPLLTPHHHVRLYTRQPPPPGHFPPQAEIRVIPFPRLWTHLRLSWEMARYPPDLLFVPAHVLPLIRPRRTIVTVHDVGYRSFPNTHPWRQRLYLEASTRWNVAVADLVLTVSIAARQDVLRFYSTPPRRVVALHPGFDTDLHPVRDRAALEAVRRHYHIPNGRYILYLGRIQPRKNLARLVRAFAPLARSKPKLTLVLAGPGGWLESEIRREVARLGLERRVLFPGYIAAEEKAALLSGACCFAYPSLHEGFGFPVLEAQACDCPVLTSNGSSLPEVAGDGALFINPLDEEAITEGLRRLLEEEALRQQLIQRGRENLHRFSWEKTARHLARMIEAMVTNDEFPPFIPLGARREKLRKKVQKRTSK